MAWVAPSYISEHAPWKNEHFGDMLDALDSALGDLNGTNFAAGTLNMATDLIGGTSIFGMRKMFGPSTSARVIDSTAYDFGKSGNSAAQNLTALQNAIDALPDTGGTVLIPPGTYSMNSSVILRGTGGAIENVTIQGFGRSTVITAASGNAAGVFSLGGSASDLSGHCLKDFVIDANSVAGRGIYVNFASNVTIENIGLKNTLATYDALYVFRNTTNIDIRNCVFEDIGDVGVNIYTTTSTIPTGVTVSGCYFDSVVSNGILYDDGIGIVITDNYFKDCGGSSSVAAIKLDVYSGLNMRPAIISGNTIQGGSGYGILVIHTKGTPEFCRGHIIEDNVILETTGPGVAFVRVPGDGGDTCYIRNTIAKSNVIMDASGSEGFGIIYRGHRGGATDGDAGRASVVFANAVARNNLSGISLYSPGNTHGSSGDIMRNNAVVANSSCDDKGDGSTQDYGIHLNSYSTNASWIQKNVIVANVVKGNATAEFMNEGDETQSYGHNPGY